MLNIISFQWNTNQNCYKRTSGQDGGIGRHAVPPQTTKRRTTKKLKTKKQPELIENQTIWKSDKQGLKEETLIQTSRRGGDGQLGREDSPQGGGWQTQRGGGLWTGTGQAAASRPHKVVAGRPCGPTFTHIDNWEEQWGSEADWATQGSRLGK